MKPIPPTAPPAAPAAKNWKRFALGLVLSLFFLWLAFRKVELGEVVAQIKTISLGWLALSIAVTYVNLVVRAWRWRYLLIPIKRISLWRVFSYLMVGFTLNNLLPFRAGELGKSALLGEKEGVSKSSALASVAAEFCFSMVGMVIFFPALLTAVALPADTKNYMLIVGAVTLGVVLAAYFAVLMRDWSLRLIERALVILPGAIRARVGRLATLFFDGLTIFRDGRRIAVMLGWSAAIWLIMMVATQLRFLAFDIDLGFHAAMAVVIAVNIASALPSSPGQIGVAHWAFLAALTLFGVERETVLAFGLVSHAAVFLQIVIPGAVIILLQSVDGRKGPVQK